MTPSIGEFSLKVTLSYNGYHYHGFQFQPNAITVMGALSKCFQAIFKTDIKLYGSGRTDKGVHASGQVISAVLPFQIPEKQLLKALNSLLPDDILCIHCCYVEPSFHALHSAKYGSYRYLFSPEEPSLGLKSFVHFSRVTPSFDTFQLIQPYFLGQHDFSAFQATGSSSFSTLKTVDIFSLSEIPLTCPLTLRTITVYQFQIQANSFLYKMVRNLTGCLFEVFKKQVDWASFVSLLGKKKIDFPYTIAPSLGLSLQSVAYE
jgi:tRNA pseudouridine38-40 synthase